MATKFYEGTVEDYCTAKTVKDLLFTPAMPLKSCRYCWRCGPEFKMYDGSIHVGCLGKGIRSRDGREGQWCKIFIPRWDRSKEVLERAQKNGWPMKGPDEVEAIG